MKYIMLCLVCLFLTACTQQPQIEKQMVLVHRVIDGDTFTFIQEGKESKVRIIGVNAPELKSKDCYSQEAKFFLQKSIEGKEIILTKDPTLRSTDPYHRLLRNVDLNGMNIGTQLLEQGYARTYDTWKGTNYLYYAQVAEEAKSLKHGLWKDCTNESISQAEESTDSSANG